MASNVQITDGMIGLLSVFAGFIIIVLLFAENPGVTMGTIIGIIALVYGFYVLRASK
jgi:membrane-bound ClpP family serine protease